jgi:hypothetical protein
MTVNVLIRATPDQFHVAVNAHITILDRIRQRELGYNDAIRKDVRFSPLSKVPYDSSVLKPGEHIS